MKNGLLWRLILLVAPWLSIQLYGDTRIELTLQYPPEKVMQESIKEALQQNMDQEIIKICNKTPGKIHKKNIKATLRKYLTPTLSGFLATYAGYMAYSNRDGQISLPRRHNEPKIYLAITPKISLINVRGNTVSHREISHEIEISQDAKLYLLELKTSKDFIYWSVSEEKIPDNRKINPITLVLFTKPKNVIVPLGDHITGSKEHFMLPPVYVVSNDEQEKIITQALDIKRFFEKIEKKEEKTGDLVQQKIMINR